MPLVAFKIFKEFYFQEITDNANDLAFLFYFQLFFLSFAVVYQIFFVISFKPSTAFILFCFIFLRYTFNFVL